MLTPEQLAEFAQIERRTGLKRSVLIDRLLGMARSDPRRLFDDALVHDPAGGIQARPA